MEIPTNCPECASELVTQNDQLFCLNADCPAKNKKRVEHFCKTMEIKGLGPSRIEALELDNIQDIYSIDRDYMVSMLRSEKIADTLVKEIEQSKDQELWKALAGMSIPLIGKTYSKKVCDVVNNLFEITEEKCTEAGLGNKATTNLMYWVENTLPSLSKVLPPLNNTNTPKKNVKASKGVVCITGKLKSYKTKKEAYNDLEQAGYTISESVTKSVSYLIDESDKGSTKRTKAESLGIPIITNVKQLL